MDKVRLRKKARSAQRDAIREFIKSQKLGKSCLDCGIKGPPEIFDFDHIDPSRKRFEIHEAQGRRLSIGSVQRELENTRLICAICHRLKTFGYCRSDVRRGKIPTVSRH